jgi:DNA-binding HxlR family transcriptional regulator
VVPTNGTREVPVSHRLAAPRASEHPPGVRALHEVPRPPQDPSEWEMVHGTRLVVELLTGRWNVGVLYLLADGTRRFSELFYEVGEVSKKVLTQTLRGLERDGLIERRTYAEVPTRVEYSLTALGWSITGLLMSMYEWSARNEPHVTGARRRAEGAPEPHPRALAA